jgi:ADP-heptose:LPS heptosyltransferase
VVVIRTGAQAPQRIAVFRALMLGDMLCAVPALRALRAGHPQARITLIGLPWAGALAQRLACVDAFIAFAGHPALPEAEPDVQAWPGFLAQVQGERFDLALQMHGSGVTSNPIVATFGARRMAGFAAPDAWRPAVDAQGFRPWPDSGHEIERLLALTDHLGLPRRGTALEFPLTDDDRREAKALLREAGPAAHSSPHVCVHAGAQLPSRRWGVRRFAEVADAVAARGRAVVLTGTAAEAGLVAEVAACMQRPALNLAGRTSLWTLGALVEGAEAVVCNDTGLSHVAAALRRPSVVVACGSDTRRWAPLDDALHHVLAQPLPCRPCDFRECPYGHPCAAAITPTQAIDALASALAA